MNQINSSGLGMSTSMLGLPSSLSSGLASGMTGGLSGGLSGSSTSSTGLTGGISEMLADAQQIMAVYGLDAQSSSGGSDISALMQAMLGTGSTSTLGNQSSGSTSSLGMPTSSLAQEAQKIMQQFGGLSSGTSGTSGLTGL